MQTSTNILNKISGLDIMGFYGGLFQSGSGGGGYTYAKLINPTPGATLSSDGLTFTRTSEMVTGYAEGAYSDISKSSGKWYFEYTANTVIGGLYAGVNKLGAFANPDTSASSYSGRADTGVSLVPQWGGAIGWTTESFANYSYTPTITANGTVIGVLMDMDSKQVSFTINGTNYGVILSGFTDAFEAGIASHVVGEQYTVNFGATPFVYPVPSGYNAGLYI